MIRVGDSTISSVVEQSLSGLGHLIPLATTAAVREIDWLGEPYVDGNGEMAGLIQSFVIEHGGATVMVDTCVGDGKDLPGNPEWTHRTTGFLDRFRTAGFDPEHVDVVLCTHLHLDHVGWNTRWDGTHWVPTFPNARYLFARVEYEHWQTEAADFDRTPPPTTEREERAYTWAQTGVNVQHESVEPIVAAGLADFVEVPHEILPGLRLIATPGHTPGHVSIELDSGDASCVITGDSFHHPCQIAVPNWSTRVDTDRDGSTATRRRMLERLVGTGGLLVGSHFSAPSHGTIARDNDGYRFVPDTT